MSRLVLQHAEEVDPSLDDGNRPARARRAFLARERKLRSSLQAGGALSTTVGVIDKYRISCVEWSA